MGAVRLAGPSTHTLPRRHPLLLDVAQLQSRKASHMDFAVRQQHKGIFGGEQKPPSTKLLWLGLAQKLPLGQPAGPNLTCLQALLAPFKYQGGLLERLIFSFSPARAQPQFLVSFQYLDDRVSTMNRQVLPDEEPSAISVSFVSLQKDHPMLTF